MKINIIGADGSVTYTLGTNKYATVSGKIIDVVSLSEQSHFIVLSRNKDEMLIGLDAIYSITIKKRKQKVDKSEVRMEVG